MRHWVKVESHQSLQFWVLGQHGGRVARRTQRAIHVLPHGQAFKCCKHLPQQHRHMRLIGGRRCLGRRGAGACRCG